MRARGWVAVGAVTVGAVAIGCSGYADHLAPRAPSADNTQLMGPGATDPADAVLAAGATAPPPAPPLFVCKGNKPVHGSATIGPKGGTVGFGPNSLSVPAGALRAPTLITATTYGGDTLAVQFQPQGLAFATPVTLGLSYEHCTTPPDSGLYLVYVNNGLTAQLALVPSTDHRLKDDLVGQISHFSVYAAAERRPKPPQVP